jgi:hypothetical protein
LLAEANYSTWAWDVDEFHFATDELLIRRMLEIAQVLSETKRCSLLPLDMNVGRVTAEETLLWLTGCSPTATFAQGKWRAATRYAQYSLEQWQQSFETVIMISNLPSLRSLPNLRCDVVLQTQPTSNPSALQIAAVGLSTSGHVFRGDRGTVHYVPKGELTRIDQHGEAELVAAPGELPDLPEVAQVLNELAAMNSKKTEASADAH